MSTTSRSTLTQCPPLHALPHLNKPAKYQFGTSLRTSPKDLFPEHGKCPRTLRPDAGLLWDKAATSANTTTETSCTYLQERIGQLFREPHPKHVASNKKYEHYWVKLPTVIIWYGYRPGVAQRVGRGIALIFHDRATRRGWVFSSTPQPHFTHGKTRYPFYRRLGGPQGRYGRAEKSRPHRGSIPDRPARSQSLYRLSYRAHYCHYILVWTVLTEVHSSSVFLPRNTRN